MRLIRYSYPTYRQFVPASPAYGRSAWGGLEAEIDRLFANSLGDFAGREINGRFPVDFYSDKANTYVRAELPGFTREDINVEVVGDQLVLTAVRKTPATEGKAEEAVTFTRSIDLNNSVQTENVGATYENGVLTVTLPKREEAKPKAITVAVK